MAVVHITLATRDVLRTRRFFELACGWTPIRRDSNIPRDAAWLAIAPGQELHILEVPDFEPSPYEQEYGRHIALAFPLAEFPALKERLERHGAELIEAQRATRFERFFFKDPNGYVFEVVADDAPPGAD